MATRLPRDEVKVRPRISGRRASGGPRRESAKLFDGLCRGARNALKS
jgi:hypothetical protein